MLNALKIAVRRLAKAPVFTVTALATLALCIGANVTIFAVVDAILVRSLPFPHAERLVTMYYVYPKMPSATSGASVTNYYERRGKIPALASISAISESSTVIGESGATSLQKMGRITPEFLSTLGVAPSMGRAFTESEMTYNTDHEAMLSYEYWQAAYGSDLNVIGKTIRIDGDLKRIVGVLPAGFRFLSFRAPVYMPLSTEESERNVGSRHSIGSILIGRIAEGASLANVQAQVDARDAAIAPEFPEAKIVADAGARTVVAPLQGDYVASVRPMLILLQIAALFLLLIGCVNLVNLLLIRSSHRSRELAIRQALGAGTRQVIGDIIGETMILAFIGSALGLWVGDCAIGFLGWLGVDQLPLGSDVEFDGRLIIVGLLAAVVVGAGVALPLAGFNLRGRAATALNLESRGGTAGNSAVRMRRGFIIAQITLAFVLLTGASLLGISLRRAMAISPGFKPDQVVTGTFNLTWHDYPELKTFSKFFDQLSEKARAFPGISAVGAVTYIPVAGPAGGSAMTVRGASASREGKGVLVHDSLGVAGDYFQAMGIPLRDGRFLGPGDASSDDLTCVVDDNFARIYWPDGSALGKQVYPGSNPRPEDKFYTIVGVVGSVKQAGLTEKSGRGAVYIPYSREYFRNYYLVARTSLAVDSVGPSLTRMVREADPDVALNDIRPMEVRISDSLSPRRSPALMAGIFAGSALLLAVIGLYGVMGYAVAQRTREFGVRIALGALSRDVLRMVFLEGAWVAATGLAAGLVLSLFLTRYMASQLYEVKSSDPSAFVSVTVVITTVVSIACLLPARRATKVDPMVALRAE